MFAMLKLRVTRALMSAILPVGMGVVLTGNTFASATSHSSTQQLPTAIVHDSPGSGGGYGAPDPLGDVLHDGPGSNVPYDDGPGANVPYDDEDGPGSGVPYCQNGTGGEGPYALA